MSKEIAKAKLMAAIRYAEAKRAMHDAELEKLDVEVAALEEEYQAALKPAASNPAADRALGMLAELIRMKLSGSLVKERVPPEENPTDPAPTPDPEELVARPTPPPPPPPPSVASFVENVPDWARDAMAADRLAYHLEEAEHALVAAHPEGSEAGGRGASGSASHPSEAKVPAKVERVGELSQ